MGQGDCSIQIQKVFHHIFHNKLTRVKSGLSLTCLTSKRRLDTSTEFRPTNDYKLQSLYGTSKISYHVLVPNNGGHQRHDCYMTGKTAYISRHAETLNAGIKSQMTFISCMDVGLARLEMEQESEEEQTMIKALSSMTVVHIVPSY